MMHRLDFFLKPKLKGKGRYMTDKLGVPLKEQKARLKTYVLILICCKYVIYSLFLFKLTISHPLTKCQLQNKLKIRFIFQPPSEF